MKQQKFSDQFASFFKTAVDLCDAAEADAILVMLDNPTEWKRLREIAGDRKVLVAVDQLEELAGSDQYDLLPVILDSDEAPVFEKLTQAMLESVANDQLSPHANVLAVYSGFEAGKMDSISFIQLDDHLGRLTSRDLRKLETSVPLDTMKSVIDLAVEIGREGREGKSVGTMFVVGDTRAVLQHCHAAGFDAVKGYTRKERNLQDRRTRESIKEVAQMDGAFIISPDGTIERSCQLVDAPHAGITLTKGLGSRHWAAAAITKVTNALGVVVSESNGTVRLFQNGHIVLRVEPFQRAMKWVDFDYEPPVMKEEA